MIKIIFISIASYFLLAFSFLPFTNASPKVLNCEDAQGLKVVVDYDPAGKAIVKKLLTPLFTEQSDESYLTHLIVKESKFKSENVEVLIDILNFEKKSIKKYLLKNWIIDKDLLKYKITKTNLSKFLKAKIADPYDTYANLEKTQKSQQAKVLIPSDAKIYIRNTKQIPFCSFEYKYGSVSEY